VTVAWEPTAGPGAARGDVAARITIAANRPKGEIVFETEPADLGASGVPQNVSFDVAAGSLELKIIVTDREGQTLDRETRPIDVPDYAGGAAVLGTPRFYRARTTREFQALVAGADASPVAMREFPRTERLLIRFDLYAPEGETPTPSAAILSRAGRRMFDVAVARMPETDSSHQIDLTLSPLPAGEYLLEVAAAPSGSRQLAAFRVR
jgi:hypothetical protein